MDYKLYDSYFAAMQIENQKDSDVIISETNIKEDSLQLFVSPFSQFDSPIRLINNKKYYKNGYKILLINNSEEDYNLFNRDGKIMIHRQVFYKNEWRDVKSYKKTMQFYCGNSFMRQKIIYSKNHFTFIASCLEGDSKVKFRFMIVLKDGAEYIPVYSNEFDAYINEALIE